MFRILAAPKSMKTENVWSTVGKQYNELKYAQQTAEKLALQDLSNTYLVVQDLDSYTARTEVDHVNHF